MGLNIGPNLEIWNLKDFGIFWGRRAKKVRFGWRLDIDVELIDNYYEDGECIESDEESRGEDADEAFVCEGAAKAAAAVEGGAKAADSDDGSSSDDEVSTFSQESDKASE